LNLLTIPWTRLDPGNGLARAYLAGGERIFPVDFRDPRALRHLAGEQGRRARPPLAKALEAYNREVGGSAENAAAIDDSLCVVSGQQVGLLLGPLYTTWKLFTTILAARALSEELRARVVPVFWVESEDHDWDEVNRFFVGERRFRIETDVPRGTPLHDVEAEPAAFLEAVRAELGPGGEAWRIVEPERNVARWHVRNLARLVEGEGVVFLEPRLLRGPMRAFAGRIAASSAEIDRSIDEETGFPKRLGKPDGAYLFDASAGRRRLARGADVPEAWSSDVASRVLVQNAALPVVAAVCGPAEVQYWAQLRRAHEALGVPMPAVVPRHSATLVEAGPARDAARLGLSLEEVVRGVSKPPDRGASDPIAARLRKLAGEARELFGAVESGALDLPPNAEKPFHRTVSRLREDLEALAGRIDAARADAEGVGTKRYERILEALRPRNELQERTQSLLPFLLRHGPGLAKDLRESFRPFEIGHYLVTL
jgi:uncharacterized protein YllA (UPF0747 family)